MGKKIFCTVAVILLLIIGVYCSPDKTNSINQVATKTVTNNENKDENTYQKAISLIQVKNYDGASKLIAESGLIDKKYKNSEILFKYVSSQKFKNNEAHYAKSFLDRIPQDYDGEFKDEINLMRKEINPLIEEQRPAKEKEKHEKETKDKEKAAQQQEIDSHIYVGDAEEKIINVFGQPERVNKTVTGGSVHKQYVYGRGHYIYTENGIVTSFQSSN